MSKEFEARFDLRVDLLLKKRFKKFCKDNDIKLSEAGREAIALYLHNKTLVNTLIENLQDTKFFMEFFKFYQGSPTDIQEAFSDLLGPAEEQLIKNTPPQLLRNIHVVTKRGKEALEKLL